MALSLQGINSFTNKDIVPALWNNVFMYSPLFIRARTKNSVRFSGGTQIQIPITYKKLAGGAFTRGSAVDITFINTETAFTIYPKYYYTSVVLYGTDGVLNMGPEAAFSIVEAKLANASATMAENLATDIYFTGQSNGTITTDFGATDTGTTQLDGLCQWIDDGVIVTTVGGITRTDLAANSVINGGNGYTYDINGSLQTSRLNTAIGKSWFGPDRVDLIVMNSDTFMYLHNKLQPSQRFAREDADVVKAGFRSINYIGADVVVDNYCPAGVIFGLNSRVFQFHISTNRLFEFGFTGFKEDQATVGDIAGQYAFAGNVAYPSPRTGFKLMRATS
jgi:hypothetical protein